MDTFVRFLYEFINQTVSGIIMIFRGLIDGIKTMFNIKEYTEVFRNYYACSPSVTSQLLRYCISIA